MRLVRRLEPGQEALVEHVAQRLEGLPAPAPEIEDPAPRRRAAADHLDRRVPADAPLEPMPRHTSFDEVVGDLRNRINSGFGAGQRPYY